VWRESERGKDGSGSTVDWLMNACSQVVRAASSPTVLLHNNAASLEDFVSTLAKKDSSLK